MSDPGDAQVAVDRYRDLAKYLIGILAAIGALMVAGTQLSSIGELSWSADKARLIAAGAGLAVALLAIIWIVWRALDVLKPVEISLQVIDRDKRLRTAVEDEPGLLGGAKSVAMLMTLVKDSPLTDTEERAAWRKVAARARDRAAFVEMRRRFDRAWHEMIPAAVIGAAAIAVLAWAANPPKQSSTESAQLAPPTPTPILVSLTSGGLSALGEAVGEECPEPISGLVIGGSKARPLVVTTASDPRCKPAQFVLSPTWGHARNPEAAAAR
jgi:hypothetical protein